MRPLIDKLSEKLPLITLCLSSLPGIESKPRHVRKLLLTILYYIILVLYYIISYGGNGENKFSKTIDLETRVRFIV